MKRLILIAIVIGSFYNVGFSQKQTATKGTFTDSRDGNTYRWVKIGKQIWMMENLCYIPKGFLASGDELSYDEPLCYLYDYYEDIEESLRIGNRNMQKFGALYNWEAAKRFCPQGWHLSSWTEWQQLTDYLGGVAVAGDKLKMSGNLYWAEIYVRKEDNNGNATNSSGFTALPGGYLPAESHGTPQRGKFSHIGWRGYWWTSSPSVSDKSINAIFLDSSDSGVMFFRTRRDEAFSVRCVRDY